MLEGYRMTGKKANDVQYGGDHYQVPIQPWDYIIANGIGYAEGTAIKYLSRWKRKGGLQDLYKARHFLDKLIEVEEEKEKQHAVPDPDAFKLPEEILDADTHRSIRWK